MSQSTGKSTYAGYARFGSDGSFQGTAGGYGRNRNSNSASRNASRVQNTISTVSAGGLDGKSVLSFFSYINEQQ